MKYLLKLISKFKLEFACTLHNSFNTKKFYQILSNNNDRERLQKTMQCECFIF